MFGDAEYQRETEISVGREQTFKAKQITYFFRWYLRSLQKKANVTIKVENKEGY